MCGIVESISQNPKLKPKLGKTVQAHDHRNMTNRGPDSAGRCDLPQPGEEGQTKFSLAHDDANYDWKKIDVGWRRR
jgi:hypothetical protein